MKRFSSIKNRLYMTLILITVFFAADLYLSLSSINAARNIGIQEIQYHLYEGEKAKLRTAVHAMALALGKAVKEVNSEAAQIQLMRKMLDPIRYESDQSGYFFVCQGTINRVLPTKKELQDTDMGKLKDKNGKYFTRELFEKATRGGGFVEYVFPKPEQGNQPKLGYCEMIPGTDFWIGSGVYIDNIEKAKQNISEIITGKVRKKIIFLFIVTVGMLFAVILPISLAIIRKISTALDALKASLSHIAKNDLTVSLDMPDTDEFGQMAKDFNDAIGNLHGIITELTETAHKLSTASEEMSDTASQMASSANEMSLKASDVASASDQVSLSVETVASATEQSGSSVSEVAQMTEAMSAALADVADFGKKTSENVNQMAESGETMRTQMNTVSDAVTLMTLSLNEVAKRTAKASQISQNANQRTEHIDRQMDMLVTASKQIDKVVSVIKDIADQTNMLALNATIEAAGAGSAGKGFAVVANEVKELAKQSAEATDEIAGQIEAIQTSVGDAVKAIGEISEVINEIADINEMIAASVEEQTATANEISESVDTTVITVRSVAENAHESAKLMEQIATSTNQTSDKANQIVQQIEELLNSMRVIVSASVEASDSVKDISENIQGISISSKDVADAASHTRVSSDEVADMTSVLSEIVKRFKL